MLTRARRGPARDARDDRGAVAVVAAITALVLLGAAALAVDLGNTWARRGALQAQVDRAAMFAAEYLPATDSASRTTVARAVAHYLACNPVAGQRAIDSDSIPDDTPARCSTTAAITTGSDADLNAYAARLLDGAPGSAGAAVEFPSSTLVSVLGPAARVDYGFAPALGGSDGGEQQREATARVSSPGDLLPIGLSLTCLASSVSQADAGALTDLTQGVLPLSYVTTGHTSGATVSAASEPTFTPPGWPGAYTGTNASSAVTVSAPSVNGSQLSVTVASPALLPSVNNLLGGARVVFARGVPGSNPAAVTTVEGAASALTVGGGVLTATIPQSVLDTPGIWHVKVRLYTQTSIVSLIPLSVLSGTNPKWSQGEVTITIQAGASGILPSVLGLADSLLDLDQTLACARVTDSPRVADQKSPSLTFNIQEGGDHRLAINPGVASVLGGTNLSGTLNGSATSLLSTLQGLVNNPASGLLGCGADDLLDTQATYDAGQVANCGTVVAGSPTVEDQFTAGFLKDTGSASASAPGYGRLACARPGACSAASGRRVNLAAEGVAGFNGDYNNDSFSDFVKPGTTVLDSQLAYGLDTYLLPGLPLITPNENLDAALYESPRFFWAPIVTTAVALGANPVSDGPSAGSYPILTFRPVFIDNGTSGALPILGLDPSKAVDDLPGFLADAIGSVCSQLFIGLPPFLNPCQTLVQGVLQTALNTLGPTQLTDPGAILDAVDPVLKGLLQIIDPTFATGDEVAGLVIKEGKLKAVRFMTITPAALPPVPSSYDGPITDYLGVGPKVIRLVD